jgi:hypothetical protein
MVVKSFSTKEIINKLILKNLKILMDMMKFLPNY